MKYTMTTPCDACQFLAKNANGYRMRRLLEFASAAFPCHKTADNNEDDYEDGEGGYVANEKRDAPNQMMRIMERLGQYDHTKLNMEAKVR